MCGWHKIFNSWWCHWGIVKRVCRCKMFTADSKVQRGFLLKWYFHLIFFILDYGRGRDKSAISPLVPGQKLCYTWNSPSRCSSHTLKQTFTKVERWTFLLPSGNLKCSFNLSPLSIGTDLTYIILWRVGIDFTFFSLFFCNSHKNVIFFFSHHQ